MADIDALGHDNSVEGQRNLRPLEVELGDAEVGLRRRVLGFGLPDLRFADHQRGRFFIGMQTVPLLASDLSFGLLAFERHLGPRHGRLPSLHCELVVARIDLHQHLAGPEKTAGNQ